MRTTWANAIKLCLLSVLSVAFISPLLYALYVSLQQPEDYGRWVGLTRLTLENYVRVLDAAPIGQWYFNTILVTAITLAGSLIVNTIAGYALARLSFPGRNLVFMFILGMMIIPLHTYLIPLYIWISRWGWLNTYQGLTVPFLVIPFFIFLTRQFFLTLPQELEEAAAIDGLGRFGTFWKIILPNSTPVLITQIILSFAWTWNNFVVPVTMVNDPDYFVLTVGLNTLKDVKFDWPTVTMAGVMYLTIPVIVIFVFLQRHIVEVLATTGLKG